MMENMVRCAVVIHKHTELLSFVFSHRVCPSLVLFYFIVGLGLSRSGVLDDGTCRGHPISTISHTAPPPLWFVCCCAGGRVGGGRVGVCRFGYVRVDGCAGK